MSMKNSNDTIGNRTRDLTACSAVPQPTALPRAPMESSGGTEIGKLFFVVCYLLGNSPASEFYMQTFRNTRSVPSSEASRHIKFRGRGITQKKIYNIQKTANFEINKLFSI